MKREDFIATVGFTGDTAIVDGRIKKRYGKLSVDELLSAGQHRAAFCAALYDEDTTAMARIIDVYRNAPGGPYETADDLKRLFGVDSVPEQVARVKAL